jgi:hypothetical protein
MYSSEINSLLENQVNIISPDTYYRFCTTSPQINHIKYDAYEDKIHVWTSDGYYWKFSVKREY